jgi:hypothetical protein
MNLLYRLTAACLTLSAVSLRADAGMIVDSEGNPSSGFVDGQTLTTAELIAAAPTIGTFGSSDSFLNFNGTWTHTFGAIADPITSALLTFGIYDSEGGSVGVSEANPLEEVTLSDEQLDFFDVGAGDIDLKDALIAAGFEDAGQALNAQYEIYTVVLPNSTFADLATGTLEVDLGLKGPVFSPAALVFLDDIVQQFNGAHVVYSTLTINTEDNGGVVPEPAAGLIYAVILCGVAVVRRRGTSAQRS